jgi:hypothetical protein
MKPKLKPPGIELLNLKCDDPLSNFAFNVNLRRYTLALPPRYQAVPLALAVYLAGASTRPLFSST